MRLVVKIGTTSLTTEHGDVDIKTIAKVCNEVGELRHAGHEVVVVTSGAITAGLGPLGFTTSRPRDMITKKAAAAVGQTRLVRAYDDALAPFGLVAGQVLFSPRDFLDRRQYLQARETIERLLTLGVVPIINENDAISDQSVRFGDNDRLSALVAHAIGAELLVLLTDTAGLMTADPRIDENASLVEEVIEVDHHFDQASGSGTERGSGGMTSKLVAARMASRSGIRAVIANATKPGVLGDAVDGESSVGTTVLPRDERLNARRLWIAYAMPASGSLTIDDGARAALVDRNSSLLAAGILSFSGEFERDDGVEIVDNSGALVAKGLIRIDSRQLEEMKGRKTSDLPEELRGRVVHRDDLVILV